MFEKHHYSVVQQAVYDILATPSGKILIEYLISCDYDADTPLEQLTPEILAMQEGQRTLVRWLLHNQGVVQKRIDSAQTNLTIKE